MGKIYHSQLQGSPQSNTESHGVLSFYQWDLKERKISLCGSVLLCGENKLFYYFKSGETQQQLFIACITEMNGSFGVVARTFYADHLTQAEAFVLDGLSGLYAGDAGSGSRRWGERSPTCLLYTSDAADEL